MHPILDWYEAYASKKSLKKNKVCSCSHLHVLCATVFTGVLKVLHHAAVEVFINLKLDALLPVNLGVNATSTVLLICDNKARFSPNVTVSEHTTHKSIGLGKSKHSSHCFFCEELF